MIDRFKKVFVICSTEQYSFLEEHKDEILEPYKKQKIEMPYLFGNVDSRYEELLVEAKRALGDVDVQELFDFAARKLQEEKYTDAERRMKKANNCIYISPIIESEKDSKASNETILELLEARKNKSHIVSIHPTEFKKAKQKSL